IEPFQSQSSVTFTMAPETPTTTKVTWAMDGKHNFVSKAFSVVKPMDGMIGKDFEEGLANLKKVAEAKKPPPAPPAPPPEAAADAAGAAKARADMAGSTSPLGKILALLASQAHERQIAAAIVLGEIGARDAPVIDALAG